MYVFCCRFCRNSKRIDFLKSGILKLYFLFSLDIFILNKLRLVYQIVLIHLLHKYDSLSILYKFHLCMFFLIIICYIHYEGLEHSIKDGVYV